MITPIRVLESLPKTAPLGVRFLDPLSRTFIGDGLRVSAYPSGQPALRREATVNRSAIHVFHELPGLRDFTGLDGGDDASWARPKRPFVIEGIDRASRFLPFCFAADLPARGLFKLVCTASGAAPAPIGGPEGALAVPLFSAPTRQPESMFAVVRAELYDPVRSRPASFAMVEARLGDGPFVRGLADERGRLVIFLPYPQPSDLTSSPSGGFPLRPPLLQQSWPVKLRAFYLAATPVPKIPDLCTLFEQKAASLWTDAARSQPLLDSVLSFGRELVLRTVQGSVPLPTLWVTTA